MTRFEKLEDVFELPKLEDVEPNIQVLDKAKKLAEDYDSEDPATKHDHEMDEIADLAVEYGKTLHDLGMEVEVKHAGEIFSAASNMLKIAVDARNSKMEKKLKLLRLELDRLKLDRSMPDPGEQLMNESVTVIDRNALLEQIKSISAGSVKNSRSDAK
jgi:hypothetical protein